MNPMLLKAAAEVLEADENALRCLEEGRDWEAAQDRLGKAMDGLRQAVQWAEEPERA